MRRLTNSASYSFRKEVVMDVLRVTIVGQDLFKLVTEIFELVGLNPVNQVNTGMLGNLKILTYAFELQETEVIEKRKVLMNELSRDPIRLMPMYVHGDWMRIFVFKPIRI